VGHSIHSKAYKVYNKCAKNIKESVHVIFYEFNDGKLGDSISQYVNLNKHRDDGGKPRKEITNNVNSQEQPLILN